ncbi:MAG: hypothetical protein H7A25_18735 [Leptospiraceae bacterium]|nr:hypothetical protein [Leptospiraceae bacterium]
MKKRIEWFFFISFLVAFLILYRYSFKAILLIKEKRKMSFLETTTFISSIEALSEKLNCNHSILFIYNLHKYNNDPVKLAELKEKSRFAFAPCKIDISITGINEKQYYYTIVEKNSEHYSRFKKNGIEKYSDGFFSVFVK